MYNDAILIYRLLYLLTLLVFLFSGIKISKAKSNIEYWKFAFLPIAIYVVFVGLRFGRGGDYNIYYFEFEKIKLYSNDTRFEVLFLYFVKMFHFLGAQYKVFIAACSFLLIISIFYFCRNHKHIFPFALLILFWEIRPAENLIRWYIAIIPFLFMILALDKRRIVSGAFWGLSSILFHSGFFPLVLLTSFVFYYRRCLIPSYIALPVFAILTILGSSKMLLFLNPYLSFLGINERSQAYITHYQDIVNGNFGVMGVHKMGWSTQLRYFVAYSFAIYYSRFLIQLKTVSKPIINLYIIGVSLSPVLSQVEILNRYSETLLVFSMVVSGYSYYYAFSNRDKNPFCFSYAIISLICYMFPIFSYFVSDIPWNLALFVWDAKGMNYLPINYLVN